MSGRAWQPRPRWLGVSTVAVIAVALLRAWALRWVCDDAYVSFRYAEHLLAGHGLVWNPGEYVEGYTNWLFTMAIAGGMFAAGDPVAIAHALGLASYTFVLLAAWRLERRHANQDPVVPWSVWILAVMPDLLVWTTGGLETMPAAALAVGMALLLYGAPGDQPTPAAELAAGGIGGLLHLVRPDGVLIVGALGLAHVVRGSAGWPARLTRLLRLGLPIALCVVGATLGRLLYYGDWLPNTYYAKSADRPYWEAGLPYVGWFLMSNYVMVAGAALLIVCFRRLGPSPRRFCLVMWATAIVFALYVARSGGDFMFARRLVPVAPLLVLGFVPALHALPVGPGAIAGTALIAAAALPLPVFALWGSGRALGFMADEARYYDAPLRTLRARQGEALARAFEGIDAGFLIEGGLVMLAYHSKLPRILEANGLTDREIARRPIEKRGRPGHEKHPDDALLDRRRVQFIVLHGTPAPVAFDQVVIREVGLHLRVRYYDEPIMEQLARRSTVVMTPIDKVLDVALATIERSDCPRADAVLAAIDRYYFGANASPRFPRGPLARAADRRCGR